MMKLFLVCAFIISGKSWDLSFFGISENYYISSIAIYRARAFLTLPRSVCFNDIHKPTLIEVPWTGSTTNIKPIRLGDIQEYQKWGNCETIQDAVSLDIEPKRPKIWILDKGNEFCNPKILSYNVILNKISQISELTNISGKNLNVVKIDPHYSNSGFRIFIGNAGENTLLVFSTDNLKWFKLKLQEMSNSVIPINPDYLTLSKTESTLYVSGRNSLELYSINLDDIESFEERLSSKEQESIISDFSIEVKATMIGLKMGISTGLETDIKSGLNYYMIRDYVVVRWLIGAPMDAEHHRILTQSYEQLPYVAQLFTGPQYGLWALVNPLSLEECHEVNNTITGNIPRLENRVVKILKYNKFLNDIF